MGTLVLETDKWYQAAAFGQSETDTQTPQDNMWDLFKDDLVK